MSENSTNQIDSMDSNQLEQKPNGRKRRPLWARILCGLGITLLVVVLLAGIALTVLVSYLKPEKLTPLVEKYANEYLDATLNVGRVELTFWSSFPKLEVDVRDLEVTSHLSERITPDLKAELPVYADSLLQVKRFSGAINIPKLLVGEIALYDIIITRPEVNVVQATPELSNFDIFPKSEEEKKESSGEIPDISLGTFEILDGFPVRYYSRPDSIEASVVLSTTSLVGKAAPVYALTVDGLTDIGTPALHIDNLGVGLGGNLTWSPKAPYSVSLDQFKVRLGDVATEISSRIDFDKELIVETLSFALPETPINNILALIPADMRGELDKVKADLSVAMNLALTRPYRVGIDSIPSFNMSINIPEGHGKYENLNLNRFALDADAEIDGSNLDRSVVTINRLLAIGDGVGFELNGTATEILSDPAVKGTFKGGVEIQRLPKFLLSKLPCTVKGSLRADCDFSLRRSYLDKDNFHRIRLTGEATLRDLSASMPELPASLYTHEMELKLGTNSSFTRGEVSVDSLLTASLKIDTISVAVPGMDLEGKGLKMGVGCQNTASSADTTLINPIGGRIVAERLSFKSAEDSMRVRLRDATVGATLRRYKGDSKQPQLHLDIATKRAFYADRINRAMLTKAFAYVTVHPKSLRTSARMQARMDSLRKIYPDLAPDSLYRMAIPASFRNLTRDSAAVAEGQILDIEVDNTMRGLLRKWNAQGTLRADRARVFTPLFPVRNTLSGLDIKFNSDSININDTKLKCGRTDFLINGSITNITRALTSVTGRQPLVMNLNLTSDTIDVNQISAAVFAGAAFMEHEDSLSNLTADDTEDEDALEASIESQADSVAVLVVPSNVEAILDIKAHHILYSNLVFHDFAGTLNVYNGAINLSQLGARTDVGSVNLNALYNAPTRKDVSFAFGMQVADLHIGDFLDLVPALDSMMPLLQGIDGVINADIAATTLIDSGMNIDIPSLKAAVKLSGDSLVVIDDETFRKIGKWLLFKNKEHNMIDSMSVEMVVDNSQLRMFPFVFNLDRYKLGVMGNNDMAMNLNYHVAVLKSPLPFKFGINISGNPDNMKIRLGRAKFNEKNMPQTVSIADTTRINLVKEITNIFRRGARKSRPRLDFSKLGTSIPTTDTRADTISHADSLYFIKEGLIAAPDTVKPIVKKKK